jgi:hypothetical protein
MDVGAKSNTDQKKKGWTAKPVSVDGSRINISRPPPNSHLVLKFFMQEIQDIC